MPDYHHIHVRVNRSFFGFFWAALQGLWIFIVHILAMVACVTVFPVWVVLAFIDDVIRRLRRRRRMNKRRKSPARGPLMHDDLPREDNTDAR